MRAIVDLIASQLPAARTQRQADALADSLAAFSQDDRDCFARAAGCVTSPSDITWALVVDAIRASAERRSA